MKAPLTRKLSSTERLYRIAEQLSPPFAMQFVLKGDGKLTQETLKIALDQLLRHTPVLKMRLTAKQVHFDGVGPKVVSHDATSIPLQKWLELQSMPDPAQPIEFHLLQSETTTIILRVLHRAMDGEGALLILKSLFAKLNGQTFKLSNDYPIDRTVAQEINANLPVLIHPRRSEYSVPVRDNFTTSLIAIPSKFPNIIAELSRTITTTLGFPTRILVPVSVRRHGSYLDCVANLSLPVFLHLENDTTVESAQSQLLQALQENRELCRDKQDATLGRLPFWLLKKALKSRIQSARKKQRFFCTAFISDLGIVSLAEFTCADFRTTDFWAVPVTTPLIPISIQVCGHENGMRIVISCANSSLVENIERHLCERNEKDTTKILKVDVHPPLKSIWEKHLKLDLSEEDAYVSFSELGGESIKLLYIIDEFGKQLDSSKLSAFTALLIGRGTAITLAEMSHHFHQIDP